MAGFVKKTASICASLIAAAAMLGGAPRTAAPIRAGGDFTVDDITSRAYGQHGPTLPVRDLTRFSSGNRLFNTNWVAAPASVKSLDGLGPVFNRVSCSACHTRDGRGIAPDGPGDRMESMLVRLSVPGGAEGDAPKPHPVYGDQLNDRAILGVDPEGRASVTWREMAGSYSDGTPYRLRRPEIAIVDLAYGELGLETMFSPRVSPAVFGVGLLEAIDPVTILANADPADTDTNGISGRPNYVIDAATGEHVLGRFGWKANAPSIRQQAAGAARGDIGITSALFPSHGLGEELVAARMAPTGDDGDGYELTDDQLDKLTFYLRSLAVPARRNAADPAVHRGAALFVGANCAACHIPTMRTGSTTAIPALANQTIQPFTDLLLHDMGEDLADGRPDFAATGSEWRTPPLWGLGLIETVRLNSTRPKDASENLALLHDGRARTTEEAILWHGGESAVSREAFKSMSKSDRDALIEFLRSL